MEKDSITGPRLAVVALVESDDLIRTLVERWLGEAGYAVKRVTIEDLRAGNGIDLIVADVASPRAATSLIRSLQAVALGALVAHFGQVASRPGASAALAQQLGVSAVLPKPFTRDELLTGVVAAMAGRRE